MVAEVSPQIKAPIILFTYYNPILNKGIRPFLLQIAAAGVKGLVVPDLPLEFYWLRQLALRSGLSRSQLNLKVLSI